MIYQCPKCKSDNLRHLSKLYECMNCHAQYNIVEDIPDFRVFRDNIYSNPVTEAKGVAALLENYSSKSVEDLLEIECEVTKYKNENNYTALKLINQNIQSVINNLITGRGLTLYLDHFGIKKEALADEVTLDIGCGFCSNTIQLAKYCKNIIATDISMTELIIAKKILQQQGINNVALVCACAEALPFSNNQFGYMFASEVIEHVQDQGRFLYETHRILRDEGSFIFTSPNRFFIGKEPHVNIAFVGFMPRRLMRLYVQVLSRGKLVYGSKRLLSCAELTKLMRRFYNNNWECRTRLYVDISSQTQSTLGRLYRQNIVFRNLVKLYDEFIYRIFCKSHVIRACKRSTIA